MQSRYLTAEDGYQIEVFTWPNEHAKAWVHILHGMAEHASRYDEFAQALVQAGYAVIAHNHRGHGNSPTAQIGLYAEQDGWNKVLNDIDVVRNSITDDLPYIMFAHSMGTFITQAYLINQPKPIQGLILSGSNLQPLPLVKAGKVVAKIERWRKGALAPSPILQFLSFGSFNNAFKPNRTDFDWLSRDEQQVDKYINDPLCGFDCHTQLWIDLFNGLIHVYDKGSIERIQSNLPILIFGGDKDPVGEMGKGLPKLAKRYEQAGQSNVTLKLYKDGRHEMLNETNKQEVISDVLHWLSLL